MVKYIRATRQVTQVVDVLYDAEHYGNATSEEDACQYEWELEETEVLESLYSDEGKIDIKTVSVEVIDKPEPGL